VLITTQSENKIQRIYALFMHSDIEVILIFALHSLRNLEQTVTFIPKSFKIVKLHYLTAKYIFNLCATISNYDFCVATLKFPLELNNNIHF